MSNKDGRPLTRLREWCLRLWGTFRPADAEEELRFHLEMAEKEALRRGESPRDARLRAGGIAQASEAVRDQRTFSWLADFLRDTRHGVRLLARSPLFTAAAIVSLALGIGANTAIFSLIDAVMLRTLPVRRPERLVELSRLSGSNGRRVFSYPLYRQLRDSLHSFDGILARSPMGRREVYFAADLELVQTEIVSGNYYSVLGISASAGRVFDEQTPGPVAVLSDSFWQRRFGREPAVIGRTFRLNQTVFTVVGVAPPEFFGVAVGQAPDITFPISVDAEVRGGNSWLPYDSRGWLSLMGRLRDGQTRERAQTEVSAVFARAVQAQSEHAPNEFFRKQTLDQRLLLDPAAAGFNSLRLRFSEPLRILMGIVALVLLIACANLANLLFGRAAARRREIAVRLSLGAARGRVVRMLLAEGLILAAGAGVLGVLLAWWSANALVTVMSNGAADRIAVHIRPDLRILSFAAAVSFAACLLFSLAPAIQAVRQGIHSALGEARAPRWRLGRALIAAQVAISVVLLIGAGLFARTLLRLYAIETGFDRSNVLLFDVDSTHASFRGPALRARLLDELRGLAGAASASFAMSPVGLTGWDGSVRVEGHTYAPDEDDRVQLGAIESAYFQTLRTPLVLGREFDARDTRTSPPVAVVNEALVRRYFPGRSPLGKWINLAGETARREIVGVVRDTQPRTLRAGVPPMLYVSLNQRADPGWGSYLVRGIANPAVAGTALKRVDSKLRIENVRTLEEDLSRSILNERILGTLSGFFGALALILVMIGIYGVMAFQVARRRKEIGIRMALGARPLEIARMVLTETALPVAFGVAAGIAAAWLPSRAAARLSPVDTLRADS
jgi:predicted permease